LKNESRKGIVKFDRVFLSSNIQDATFVWMKNHFSFRPTGIPFIKYRSKLIFKTDPCGTPLGELRIQRGLRKFFHIQLLQRATFLLQSFQSRN